MDAGSSTRPLCSYLEPGKKKKKHNPAAARSQDLAALDMTLQPGTTPQTGKPRNIALKHAVPPQTAAVSLQEAVTALPVGLETLVCWLPAERGSRLAGLEAGGRPDRSAPEEELGGEPGLRRGADRFLRRCSLQRGEGMKTIWQASKRREQPEKGGGIGIHSNQARRK